MSGFRRLVLFSLLLARSAVFAASLSESEALNIALKFQQERTTTKLRSAALLKLESNIPSLTPRNPAFFIYNIGDNQGFVLVSGESGTKTILGYSDVGNLQAASIPDNLKAWLDLYEQEINALRSDTLKAKDTESIRAPQPKVSTPIVPPLLGMENWAQLNPFNIYCPWDLLLKSRSAVGCVALAMGQVMNYHKWPIKPKGLLNYYVDNIGVQRVNLDTITYDWERMSLQVNPYASAVQDTLIARFLYHCGASVRMQYSAGGSEADIANVGPALVDHFNYDPDIQYYKREFYLNDTWEAMLRQELDEDRPVLYAAKNKNAGHAFVCDGYDSNNLFHINWGWGGNGNGFFELSSLNNNYPNEKGVPDGFSKEQSMLIGIQRPDQKSHPSYSLCLMSGNVRGPSTTFFRKDTYSLRFDCKNLGTNQFVGYLGLGYCDENNQVKLLEKTATKLETIPTGNSKSYAPIGLTLPSNLSKGLYRIFAIYRPNDSIKWSILPGTNGIHLQVGEDMAKFIYDTSYSLLELKSPINIVNQLYQNQNAEVYVTFMNYNNAFNATLIIDLYSYPNAQFLKTIYQGTHPIQADAIQTFKLKTKLNCLPGNYSLVVRSNSPSEQNFIERMEPYTCNNLTIHVNPAPGPPNLVLTDSLKLIRYSLQNRLDSIQLKATVDNQGGFANTTLFGLVYQKGGGICLDTLDAEEIYIDSTERVTLYLKGNQSYHDGAYQVTLCEKIDSMFVPLNPIELSCFSFTVGNPLASSDTLNVYWHLSNDQLCIEGGPTVDEVSLFNLSGLLQLKVQNQDFMPVGTLPKGIYIMKVTRNKKVFFDKFFRK